MSKTGGSSSARCVMTAIWRRHRREIERVQRLREVEIPAALEPAGIPGLSREVVEQLERHRPATLADAERLPGMTPSAVAILAGRIARWGEAG